MSLGVLILNVDGRRKRSNRVAIDRPQLFIQPSILCRTLGHLFEEPVRMNADADMSCHGPDGVEIFCRKFSSARFLAEKNKTPQLATNYHGNQERDAICDKRISVPPDESVCRSVLQ